MGSLKIYIPQKYRWLAPAVILIVGGALQQTNWLSPSNHNNSPSKPKLTNIAEPADGSIAVKRVIDGDTIELENGERVRYIGINAPETVDPRRMVQCFGNAAKAKNTELTAGQKVRLEPDVSERDQYGRLLRYVYVGETFINLELVRQGYAYASPFPPDVKYKQLFYEAGRAARETNLGLWQACPHRPKAK
ncbi:MAG: thermonuclease family protein [Patescibacteria group bacterium]